MTDMVIGTYAGMALQPSRISGGYTSSAHYTPIPKNHMEPMALYVSPVTKVDPKTKIAVLVFRDSETGEVKKQFALPNQVREKENSEEESAEGADAKAFDAEPEETSF